jgi:hypothetical protein
VALPSPSRTADGRFGWQVSEAALRLRTSADPAERDELLGRLHVRAGAHRPEGVLVSEDRLPRLGPTADSTLLLACGPEPVGLAFVAARWIAEWLRTGRDPTPAAFRASRP